ncbi:unnamed protein product [Trichobilharzia regenti]|nr:unnamed protein product [Trichobilharzia regenti]
MQINGCMGSNLSDIFPSVPIQDSTGGLMTAPGMHVNGPNINHGDSMSRLQYLGLSLLQNGQNGNGGTFLNEDRSRTNLIINYLPQSFDQNDLQRLFERESGASLCYGFVDYVNPQHAALAIQTYHGYECDRKRLRVAYASSGNRPQKFSNVNDISGNPNVEVTNENILGWEVLVTGTPIEWNEQDLLVSYPYRSTKISAFVFQLWSCCRCAAADSSAT